jgi:hypothetical protein
MGGHQVGQREPQQGDELGRHLVALVEAPAAGLLGVVAAAWSQLPMDVAATAAAASLPACAETDSLPVHSGGDAVAARPTVATGC